MRERFIDGHSVVHDLAVIGDEMGVVHDTAALPSLDYMLVSESNLFLITPEGRLINI